MTYKIEKIRCIFKVLFDSYIILKILCLFFYIVLNKTNKTFFFLNMIVFFFFFVDYLTKVIY